MARNKKQVVEQEPQRREEVSYLKGQTIKELIALKGENISVIKKLKL